MAEIYNMIGHFFARCSECDSQEFSIILDGPGNNWTRIIGTMCLGCEQITHFIPKKDREKKNDSKEKRQ